MTGLQPSIPNEGADTETLVTLDFESASRDRRRIPLHQRFSSTGPSDRRDWVPSGTLDKLGQRAPTLFG